MFNVDLNIQEFLAEKPSQKVKNSNPPAARGGLKEIIQICSYRLAKPLKQIKLPKVAKSEANSHFSHRAQLGPRWPKSKSFKAQNQALAFRFQGKKRFGSIQLF